MRRNTSSASTGSKPTASACWRTASVVGTDTAGEVSRTAASTTCCSDCTTLRRDSVLVTFMARSSKRRLVGYRGLHALYTKSWPLPSASCLGRLGGRRGGAHLSLGAAGLEQET